MKWRSGSATLIGLGLIALPTFAEPEVLFERAELASSIRGRVSIQRQFQVTLALPDTDCAGERFSCRRERTYGQFYQLAFDRIEHRNDGASASVDQLTRIGRIAFVTDLNGDEELQLEEHLLSSIRGLRGDAFRLATAGWLVGSDEIPIRKLLGESGRTVWSCSQSDDVSHATFALPAEKGGYTLGNAPESAKDAACNLLLAPFDEAGAETHLTGIHVDQLEIVRVTLSRDWYPGSGDERALYRVPEALEYRRERVTEGEAVQSGYGRHEKGYKAVEVWDGIKRTAILGPVEIEPPDSNSASWVTRWRIERLRRSFGRTAAEELLSAEEFWVCGLPIGDPSEADIGAGPRVAPPNDSWIQNVQRDLEKQSTVTAAALFRSFQSETQTRGKQRDWIVLACLPDGSGRFSLSGFSSSDTLSNAPQVCDAVYRLYAPR